MAGYYGFTLAVRVSVCPSIFSFPDNYFSKYQWSFTKLDVCIDIMDIWLGIREKKIIIMKILNSPAYLQTTFKASVKFQNLFTTVRGGVLKRHSQVPTYPYIH